MDDHTMKLFIEWHVQSPGVFADSRNTYINFPIDSPVVFWRIPRQVKSDDVGKCIVGQIVLINLQEIAVGAKNIGERTYTPAFRARNFPNPRGRRRWVGKSKLRLVIVELDFGGGRHQEFM